MADTRFPTQLISGLVVGAFPEKNYTVKKGDSLSAIAKRFDTTQAALLQANPQIKNADRLQIGDRLTIPAEKPKPQAGGGSGIGGIMIATAFTVDRSVSVTKNDDKISAQLFESGKPIDRVFLGNELKRGGVAYHGTVSMKEVIDRQNRHRQEQRDISPEEVLIWLTSLNEGKFDAVNTESPTDGLAVGIMQWQPLTGELPQMLYEFNEKRPMEFQTCFGIYGITVEQEIAKSSQGNVISYKIFYNKEPLVEGSKKNAKINPALKPEMHKIAAIFAFAGRNAAFQDHEITTAKKRLRGSLDRTIDAPAGRNTRWPDPSYAPRVIDVVNSYPGVAMIFDMNVIHGPGATHRVVEDTLHTLCKRYGDIALQDSDLLTAALIVARRKEFDGSIAVINKRVEAIMKEFRENGHKTRTDNIEAKIAQLEKDKVFK